MLSISKDKDVNVLHRFPLQAMKCKEKIPENSECHRHNGIPLGDYTSFMMVCATGLYILKLNPKELPSTW